MRIKEMAKRIAGHALERFGYELRSAKDNRVALTMQAALSRRAISGLEVRTVVDVGASNGQWSRVAQQYYPDAFYFLIEANRVHEQELRQYKSENANIDYILSAAGDYVGEIYFDGQDPFGGQASYSATTPDHITVPVTTIDSEISQRCLRPPFLLKLDTHGFELPILRGARATLRNTNLIVMETYNFTLTHDSLRFWEMCSYLEPLGFRPIDIVDPLHRPKDQAFWQMDLFFVPTASNEFESNTYR